MMAGPAARIQWDAERGDMGQTADCDALRLRIDELQREFETLWLQVSSGATPTPRYREVRRELNELRGRYSADCGTPNEQTSLPRSITADWKAG
jgi:hypothetical protein